MSEIIFERPGTGITVGAFARPGGPYVQVTVAQVTGYAALTQSEARDLALALGAWVERQELQRHGRTERTDCVRYLRRLAELPTTNAVLAIALARIADDVEAGKAQGDGGPLLLVRDPRRSVRPEETP